MKTIALALVASLAAGAALADPPAIVDARPAKDATTEMLSLWATSCRFEIKRLGDDYSTPPKLDLLKSDLAAAMGPGLTSVTVTHYSILLNAQASAVASNPFGQGLVGDVLNPNCSRAETGEGGLDASEMHADRQELVVEIDVAIGSTPYTARTVYDIGLYRVEAGAPDIIAALHKANAELAAHMKGESAPPEPAPVENNTPITHP